MKLGVMESPVSCYFLLIHSSNPVCCFFHSIFTSFLFRNNMIYNIFPWQNKYKIIIYVKLFAVAATTAKRSQINRTTIFRNVIMFDFGYIYIYVYAITMFEYMLGFWRGNETCISFIWKLIFFYSLFEK